jgi:hypothetical protein
MAEFFVSMAARAIISSANGGVCPACRAGGGWGIRLYVCGSGRGAWPRWGRNLTFSNDKDGEARRRSEDPVEGNGSASPSRKKKRRGPAPEVGHALRAAYDQAVNEDIPPEMLDLLGQLG